MERLSFNHKIIFKTFEEKFLINLYELSVCGFVISFVMALLYVADVIDYIDAQTENSINKTDTVHVYGCDMYPNKAHCELVPNKFDSFEIGNVSSIAYTATNDNPLLVNGKIGSALKLYASHLESVEISNKNEINPNVFSISFWAKSMPDLGPDFYQGDILSHTSADLNSGWFVHSTRIPNTSDQSLRFVTANDQGNQFSTSAVHLTSDKFYHIVATFDGLYLSIYENGDLLGKTRFVGTYIPNPNVPLKIGGSAYGPTSNPWSGIIDDLRLYNKSLSENQIKEILANNPNIDNNNDSLIGHWSFDGTTGDVSNHNNDGRLTTMISSMAFAPDGRLFFSEKNTGKIRIMKNNQVLDTPFVTISDHYINWEQGLLGLTIDPNFQENHFLYLYYTSINNNTGEPFNRVVRFTDNNNKGVAMNVLIDKIPASKGYHSGGAMAFGKDDKLYITVGDAASPCRCVQQNSSSLLGKVLRINRDGTIPSDNPYPNSPVYNLGHRNMYGIAFDDQGFGIVTENGATLYDEINGVEIGNYGYPEFQPPDKSPTLSNSSIKPIRSYWQVIAPTQAIYYQGTNITELTRKFLFGSDTSGQIYALGLDNENKSIITEEKINLNHHPYEPVIAIAESPDGEIYYGGYSVYKLHNVDTTHKKQILFPIETTSSHNVNVDYVEIDLTQKKISISFNPYIAAKNTLSSSSELVLRFPRQLIEDVSSVSAIYSQTEMQLPYTVSEDKEFLYLAIQNTPNDSEPPTISITSPPYPPTLPSVPTKTIIVNGTAFDTGSGIQKVEAFVHTFPFDNKYPFTLAIPASQGNWSKWSIPLNITTPGYHRILVQATDGAGNQNWDEVVVTVPSSPFTIDKITVDSEPPTISITSPPYPPTLPSVPTKTIIVNGTAFDTGSGIQKVEVFINKFPFDGSHQRESIATPLSPGNWSKWSIPLNITTPGYYKADVCTSDISSNYSCDELIINIPSTKKDGQDKSRIAFVDPIFTHTAYNGNNGSAFYEFYFKYPSTPIGEKIKNDLHLLKDIPVSTRQDIPVNATTTLNASIATLDADERLYITPFIEHVEEFVENGTISLIRDEDIHHGYIFTDDGGNAYDVIFLLHDEYMTQNGYDNLKRFVANGGTIVFLDGNIFYAEVSYDENKHSISLLKGHDWAVGDDFATKSISERWYRENKEWMGSNFLPNDITDPVYFKNNPFNYSHFEENYVSNPNSTILVDYNVGFGEDYPYYSHKDVKIATYEKSYGRGKVIMIGLHAQNLANNKEFKKFFDNTILPHALAPVYNIPFEDKDYGIYWQMASSNISNIRIDNSSKTLIIDLDKPLSNQQFNEHLFIILPKQLIDIVTDGTAGKFIVSVNGKVVQYSELSNNLAERGLLIPIFPTAKEIQIVGNYLAP
jgi:glucose/arabinose dehydrogenase